MNVRAVLCDLGGVVIKIDTDRIRRAWAARSGLPTDEAHAAYPDHLYEAFERDEISEQDYFAHVRAQLRLQGTDEDLAADFNDLYLGVDHGVIRTLSRLRQRGLWLGALTNTNRTHHRVWSSRFAQDLRVFDAVYCSFELRARKPEPEAFAKVLRVHGLEPQETVFVDDVDEYVAAAVRMGLHGILFSNASMLADRLNGLLREG